jgi:ABC-2 type transport system permease protein
LIDALRHEWVRLRTIRSTYWLVGSAIVFQVVLSIVLAIAISTSDTFGRGDSAFEVIATLGASGGLAPLFVAYIIGLFGVFSFGHEYRHGMIRATLTAIPNRSHVLWAKVVTTSLVSGAAALACVVVALLTIVGFGLDLPSVDALVGMGLGTLVFTVLFSLSGLAYAALTRNQTAAVALLLLVPSVLESIIRAVVIAIKSASDEPDAEGGYVQLLKFLPYDAGGQLYTRASIDDLLSFFGYTPFGPVGGGIVMAVFVALLLSLSNVLLLRRDA